MAIQNKLAQLWQNHTISTLNKGILQRIRAYQKNTNPLTACSTCGSHRPTYGERKCAESDMHLLPRESCFNSNFKIVSEYENSNVSIMISRFVNQNWRQMAILLFAANMALILAQLTQAQLFVRARLSPETPL